MLRILPSEHAGDCKLQGDYDDLYSLRDSLQNYLEFYQENTNYPYYDYEYLLSLNYDIRHAYMGTRDFTAIDNHYQDYELLREENDEGVELSEEERKKLKEYKRTFRDKNLYFSVNIVLPLILYYLYVFQRILDAGYNNQWFEKYNEEKEEFRPDYTPRHAESDRSQIALFNAAAWDCLKRMLGEEDTDILFHYFTYNDDGTIFPAVYIDALLAYYMDQIQKLDEEDMKSFNIYTAYCIFDPVSLSKRNKIFNPCHEQYQKAWNNVKDKVTKRMPSYERFIQLENKYFGDKNEIYEDEFEEFIARYFGNPNWE